LNSSPAFAAIIS